MLPLVVLGDLAAHEQQWPAGMRPHPCQQRTQVRELLPPVPGHLGEQRSLSVRDLVMTQGQYEVLAERVQQGERELVMVVAPVHGIVGEIHQGVVHPPHVPFEPEAEPAQVGRAGDRRPGGGLLGDQHDRGVVPVNHLVGFPDEVDGLQVFPATEPVGDPLALPARVVQVKHRGDGIDAQAIDVEFLDPEQGVREQEVPDLVAPVVEHQRAPVPVLTQAGVGVLVQRRAVEARQRPVVLGEVPGDPVDEDPDARLVQPVNQIAEIVGRPVPCRRRVEPRHLITPGAGERVLRNREELDVGEAEVGEVLRQSLGRLAVRQRPPPAVGVLGQPPRAQMALVDRHRSMQQVGGLPVGEPRCVLPFVAALGDNTRGRRRHLGGERERVRPQAHMSVLAHHLEFIVCARADLGHENLPDPGAAQHSHRVNAAVPAVEVTDNPHRLCARRPHRERRAGCPLMHSHLCPEMAPQPLVPAFGQQVKVELP
jgi:hypothetical protein